MENLEGEMEFSKRLTDNARDVLALAEVFARTTGSIFVNTEHLLLGIINQQTSVAARVLANADVNFDNIKKSLKTALMNIGAPLIPTKGFSETSKLTLRMSIELSNEFHQDYCGTEHILFSLLNQKSSQAVNILSEIGADIEGIMAELERFLGNQRERDYLDEEKLANERSERQNRGDFLSKFSRNLVEMAKNDELDPVIGRDREIDRAITILSRRSKNNPILIGEAGVGKTAIVEGLAAKIANGDVPNYLINKQILQLDLVAMVAGTKFRGEFEDRLKRVLSEVRANKELIIFIDEMHLLMGAGAAEGSMDAANIMKPALSRGEFRLIGATTSEEYRKFIEKDAALTRRLQAIVVEQPNLHDTEKILKGLREKYENHHSVKISDKVIEEAVRLSERYLPERQQPDKSLDVIDEAAARIRIQKKKTNDKTKELKTYQIELKKLTENMENSVANEDYEHAALYKMRISRLNEKINECKKTAENDGKISLKLNDVAAAVSAMTGFPLEQLARSEISKLAKLEKHISRKIIGQKKAVQAVSQAIRRGRAGISDSKRPIGSFVFLGPTGVGKTELARVLAEEVFGSTKNLIKIDMSELSEKHTVSRLVGAPAGYIGYDDGGNLAEKIRRQPYSVILFDEIEKAHPSVFNLLLQILEDGRLTDGHGRSVDFSNAMIILTSNVGAERFAHDKVGFDVLSNANLISPNFDSSLTKKSISENSTANRLEDIPSALREIMRPELLNRFDAIITFDNLSHAEISQIFDLMLDNLNQRLATKGVGVTVNSAVKKWLISRSYDENLGARPLRRIIQNELENLIAEQLITKEISRGDIVRAELKNNKIILKKMHETKSNVPTKMK